MHLQMRYQNGRLNKAKLGALAFFTWAALDVTASTVVALIFKMKETEVRPSWLLGPVVFNPVSVPLALAAGCTLWLVGRWAYHNRGLQPAPAHTPAHHGSPS